MKKLSILIGVFAFTKLSFAGPDIKALIDYEKNDMKEAIAAEIAEASEKGQTSPQNEQPHIKSIVTNLEKIKDNLISEKSTNIQLSNKSLTDNSKNVNSKSEIISKNLKSKEEKNKKNLNLNDPDIEARLTASALDNKSMNGQSQELDLTSDSPILSQKVEQIGLYAGFSLTAMASNSKDTATILSKESGNDRQIGFMVNIGYDIVDNLSIEFRGTHGMVNSVVTQKFNNIALYLRPNIKLFKDVNLYALLGFGRSNLTGFSNKIGFTYGTGIKYSTLGNSEIFADAVNYLEKDGSNSMWGYNFGLEFKF